MQNACSLAARSAYRSTSINLKQEIPELEEGPVEIATFSRADLKNVSGKRIRVVMCFSKPENTLLTEKYWNNFDLVLSNNGTEVARSASSCNNVEVIEFDANETGQYKIHIELANYRLMNYWTEGMDTLHVAVSYRVIE